MYLLDSSASATVSHIAATGTSRRARSRPKAMRASRAGRSLPCHHGSWSRQRRVRDPRSVGGLTAGHGHLRPGQARPDRRLRLPPTKGPQEGDIMAMVKPITKYSTSVTDARAIRFELERAWHAATPAGPDRSGSRSRSTYKLRRSTRHPSRRSRHAPKTPRARPPPCRVASPAQPGPFAKRGAPCCCVAAASASATPYSGSERCSTSSQSQPSPPTRRRTSFPRTIP